MKAIQRIFPKNSLENVLTSWAADQRLSVECSLRNLARNGLAPRTIIDVGAYVGEWARLANGIFPDAHMLMIEAQKSKEQCLEELCKQRTKVAFEICLVGAEEQKSVPFEVLETGSSIYHEKTGAPRAIVQLPMYRLDDVVLARRLSGSFLVKLDVQGAELDVLRGAPAVLRETVAIQLETSFLPYNEGAPDIYSMFDFLRQEHFAPYDICSVLRRESDLAAFHVDFIFVRQDHQLRSARPFWLRYP